MKKVIVHRFGAFGDNIIITPIFRALKEDGYHVTFNTTDRGMDVLKYNPFIDVFRQHDASIKPDDKFDEYLANINKDYDRAINLCGSIEGTLAKVPWKEDFKWSKEKRHKECNKNFYDFSLEWAGYGNIKGKNGELYFSDLEERRAKEFRNKYKGKFLVLWVLSGSAVHKAYPYTEHVARKLLEVYHNMVIMTVGDSACELIEWSHPRTKNYSGKWSIRKTLIMTKYADLVIGPDTGILHAAGCFDTPKILFLSSNTEENLSKYWENCINLFADVECHPCHQLHYSWDYCSMDWTMNATQCTAKLKPLVVFNAVKEVYGKKIISMKVKTWPLQQHQTLHP